MQDILSASEYKYYLTLSKAEKDKCKTRDDLHKIINYNHTILIQKQQYEKAVLDKKQDSQKESPPIRQLNTIADIKAEIENNKKTIEDIDNKMAEHSRQLGNWKWLKQAYPTAKTIPKEKQEKKHKKIIKQYESKKPVREKVRQLKAKRDSLKEDIVKLESMLPKTRPPVSVQKIKAGKFTNAQPTVEQQNKQIRSSMRQSSLSRGSFRDAFMDGQHSRKR